MSFTSDIDQKEKAEQIEQIDAEQVKQEQEQEQKQTTDWTKTIVNAAMRDPVKVRAFVNEVLEPSERDLLLQGISTMNPLYGTAAKLFLGDPGDENDNDEPERYSTPNRNTNEETIPPQLWKEIVDYAMTEMETGYWTPQQLCDTIFDEFNVVVTPQQLWRMIDRRKLSVARQNRTEPEPENRNEHLATPNYNPQQLKTLKRLLDTNTQIKFELAQIKAERKREHEHTQTLLRISVCTIIALSAGFVIGYLI